MNADDRGRGFLSGRVRNEQPGGHAIIRFSLETDVVARDPIFLCDLFHDRTQHGYFGREIAEQIQPRPFDFLPAFRPQQSGMGFRFCRGAFIRGMTEIGKKGGSSNGEAAGRKKLAAAQICFRIHGVDKLLAASVV